MTFPRRLPLANLPTRLDPLPRLTAALGGPELWIKRDDQTGTEVSGNKVRKLEYAVQEALDTGCDTLITCGGIQSNHARATAAVAAKLGLGCVLVLNTAPDPVRQGNFLLDELLGAEVRFIAPTDTPRRMAFMEAVRAELAAKGRKGYILPVGASNGIGSFGYVNAIHEIAEQEQALGFRFDALVCAIGSGGTFGGLVVGHRREAHPGIVYGVPICDDAATFTPIVLDIIQQTVAILDEPMVFTAKDLHFLDGYAGRGYALSRPEEIESIRLVAKTEGIVLDPVYSGKAMHGLLTEIRKGTFAKGQRILFLHTGGLFGVFHFLAVGEESSQGVK
mgnify:CR=1 FL=1